MSQELTPEVTKTLEAPEAAETPAAAAPAESEPTVSFSA